MSAVLGLMLSIGDQNIFLLTFSFMNQTILCDHSFESSRRDDSNEWSHYMVLLRNNKVKYLSMLPVSAPMQSPTYFIIVEHKNV